MDGHVVAADAAGVQEVFMSSIIFSTKGEHYARLSGPEYTYMTVLVGDLMCAMLPMSSSITKNHIVEGHYLLNPLRKDGIGSSDWIMSLRAAINAPGTGKVFSYKGEGVSSFALSCNTAMTIGSDVVAFIAKFAGLAAGHLLIEGENKEWLAHLIMEGLATGILRQRMGWQNVIALLTHDELGPVVTHYTGTDPFPRSDWRLTNEPNWSDLDEERQWDLSEEFLRERYPDRALTSQNLRARFEHELTIFDILNQEAS